jgi:hypothetical protein
MMNWNRILSGLVAVIYIVAAFMLGGGEVAFKFAIFLVFPLFCIWFADAMGGYVGMTTWSSITEPTPGVIVCIMGWFLLLLPVITGILAVCL